MRKKRCSKRDLDNDLKQRQKTLSLQKSAFRKIVENLGLNEEKPENQTPEVKEAKS
jgi:hypothetical protein